MLRLPADRDLPDLMARILPDMAARPRESICFIYLGSVPGVLAYRESLSESERLVDVPIRAVTIDAIRLGAAAVVMAHNHPSGDPEPSHADHVVTRRLWTVLDAIDVRLIDHFVVASRGIVSLRARGLL